MGVYTCPLQGIQQLDTQMAREEHDKSSQTKWQAIMVFGTGMQRAALVLRAGNGTLCDPLGDRSVDTVCLEDVVEGTRLLVLGYRI